MDPADRAERFLSDLDLAGVPTYGKRYLDAAPPRFVPRAGVPQAAVVGSQIQAFTESVEPAERETLQNAMLLAQLAATKAAADDPEGWYQAYFDVLTNIGLVTEEKGFRSSDTGAVQADVEKVVLELAASLLGGPATTAYKVVAATLDALQSLEKDSPAVTIFRRETHREVVRFQLSSADQSADGLVVSLMAFTLDIAASTTQVLFFRSKAESAHLRHLASKLRVVESALGRAGAVAKQMVSEHVDGYVRQLQI